MDHLAMDHGHMDHGDMDMGGDQCSMNVGLFNAEEGKDLTCSDVIYLVFEEPLHYLSVLARHWHHVAHSFPHRDCPPYSWLRMGAGHQQKI
jgi:hypothetical protein